jgi:ribosomal protein S12 methylthiotransferase accessory factor
LPAAFDIGPFTAESLLSLSRVPHRYGFAFNTLGSAPHLMDFERTGDFDTVLSGDGFDHVDPIAALTRSLFEMLERVWSSAVPNDLIVSAYDNLAGLALDPRSFALLSNEELAATGGRFVPYQPNLPLSWTRAHRIASDGTLIETLVPALFVFTGFAARFPKQRTVPMLSPGLAAGVRYDHALLGAICEVIERDAFAVAWLFRQPPPRIARFTDLMPPPAAEVVAQLVAEGFEVNFHDLTRDIAVPVALCAIRDIISCDHTITVLGLGCHPRPSEAIAKSLREAMLLMTNDYEFTGGTDMTRKPRATDPPPSRRAAIADFLSSPHLSEGSWGTPDQKSANLEMPALLLNTIDTVAGAGQSIYFCDLTPATVADANRFVLVRAVIPGLQPHLYEPDCWRLDSPRLVQVARQLGKGAGRITLDMINREPNPFAQHVTT